MPGICIVKSSGKIPEISAILKGDYNQIKSSLQHLTSETVLQDDKTLLHILSHSGNKVEWVKEGDWHICFEGIEPPDYTWVEKSLSVFTMESIRKEALQAWRKQVFGNCRSAFLFVAHHQPSGIVVFANDDLARLPVYIYHKNHTLIISREYSSIRLISGCNNPDNLLLALYLIFGYAPGNGSPYRDIDTLPCCSVGLYNFGNDVLTVASDPAKRMPLERYAKSRKALVHDLRDCFMAATRSCLKHKRGLLALSGGYDSRAVAAALISQEVPFDSITYLDSDRTATQDVSSAAKLADHLHIPHSLINLPLENDSHYKSLFLIKNGLNFMGMAFFVMFLEELRKQFGSDFILLTGDGGDKVMPPLLPASVELHPGNVLQHIYAKNTVFDRDSVADVMGIATASIDEYLLSLLDSYPVASWSDRYRYFLLAERGGRWLFEGEDRNRYYCVSETPFYNLDFYNLALSIPLEWKANNTLYRKLLRSLYPPVCEVPFAGQRFKPNSLGYELLQLGIDVLRQSGAIRKFRQSVPVSTPKYTSKPFMQQHLANLLSNSSVKELMPHYPATGNWVDGEQLSRFQLSNLYTVLTMITNQY